MLLYEPAQLHKVTFALMEDPRNLGVGILHDKSMRLLLSPIQQLPFGGGFSELASLFEVPLGECWGFLIARPSGKCILMNVSPLNFRAGNLQMPREQFQEIINLLREGWRAMMQAPGSIDHQSL